MKIGVVSDTHGVVPAWQKAMDLFQNADLILHAGDVLYHPPRLGFTLGYDIPGFAHLLNTCPVPIVIARGNCDAEVYEELLEMPVLSPYAVAQVGRLRAVVNHGHTLAPDDLPSLVAKYRAHVLVTGHTHIPVVERVDGAIHINPGSCSHPKFKHNGVPLPTVGLISDDEVRVVSLKTGETILAMPVQG